MKEENETFLERVSYAMFRYGLGLYCCPEWCPCWGLSALFC